MGFPSNDLSSHLVSLGHVGGVQGPPAASLHDSTYVIIVLIFLSSYRL